MDVGQSNNRGKFPPLQLISLSIGSVVLLFYFNQLFTTASRRRTLSSKASKFNWVLSIPRTLFFLFLSFFLTTLAVRSFFLETNWIKDRRPRSKSVMWSLSKTTFEKILWSKTPSSTNKVSTTLYRVLASSTFEYFVRGVCNIFHNFLEARLEFMWKIV